MSCPTHGEDCNELCKQWRPLTCMGQGAYDPEPLNLRQREVVALERIADALDLFNVFFQRAHKL